MNIKKDILGEYATLKMQEKAMQVRMDELKAIITEAMEVEGAEELESEYGKFAIQKRRTWAYPEDINEMETTLKGKKKEAEQLGTATYTEKAALYFFGPKE